MPRLPKQVRRVHCPAVQNFVPVPSLVWERVGQDHYRAEPMPGYVYEVMPDPDSVGWLFVLPGKPPQPVMSEGVAKYSCQQWWLDAVSSLLSNT